MGKAGVPNRFNRWARAVPLVCGRRMVRCGVDTLVFGVAWRWSYIDCCDSDGAPGGGGRLQAGRAVGACPYTGAVSTLYHTWGEWRPWV